MGELCLHVMRSLSPADELEKTEAIDPTRQLQFLYNSANIWTENQSGYYFKRKPTFIKSGHIPGTMVALPRKKILVDEYLLHLILILSLLRSSPNNDPQFSELLYDFELGNSVGRVQLPSYFLSHELHSKSLDRVLDSYERSLLNNLNLLGRYDFSNDMHNGNLVSPHFEIQAYLVNGESSVDSSSSQDESGFVSGNSSPNSEVDTQSLLNHNIIEDFNRVRESNIFEELELLEEMLKQEVAISLTKDIFLNKQNPEPVKEVVSKKDINFLTPSTKDSDPDKEPPENVELRELSPDHAGYSAFNFTADPESEDFASLGSWRLEAAKVSSSGGGEVPSTSYLDGANEHHLEFNLDAALRLVGFEIGSESVEAQEVKEGGSEYGDSSASDVGGDSTTASLETINESLDEMIQASHLHPHYSRNFQGRLGNLGRSGAMEQRWQDLASLLSLPSPDPSHHIQSPPTSSMPSQTTSPIHSHPAPHIHHPHSMYVPTHEGIASSSPVVRGGVLPPNMPIALPMTDAHNIHNITYTNSMGASSHLVASSLNLTNHSDMSPSEQHHHYKMESSSSVPPDMMYYQHSGVEMNPPADGFLSSILSDEDLQLMDIPMTDYNGRSTGDYGAVPFRYHSSEDPHRHPPVAQKKHQMFGKRFFHDNLHVGHAVPSNLAGNGPSLGPMPQIVGPYPTSPPYVATHAMDPVPNMDSLEMKYSCSMDFRTPGPEVSGVVDHHVQHNHTYHMPTEGPSGINRPHSRDKKGKKSEAEKSMTRDEKRAHGMHLPITCEDIINLPMDEFNERISKFDLTEPQLSLIRDIRRRGKNKVAAQNCRKRKLDQIVHLAEEVRVIQYRKNELLSQLDQLTSERGRVKHKFSLLYRHIFQSLRDPDGNQYSPHDYSLQQSADGTILMVPRSTPPPHSTDQQIANKGRMPKHEGR